jgi:hypothetical protein
MSEYSGETSSILSNKYFIAYQICMYIGKAKLFLSLMLALC